MTRRTRRNHSPAFTANVALAAMQGAKSIAEIAQQFEVHPTLVTEWCPDLIQPTSAKLNGPPEIGRLRLPLKTPTV